VGLGETSGVVGLDLVEMGCAMRLVAGCFCRMVYGGGVVDFMFVYYLIC
jgi:hypothetical protein